MFFGLEHNADHRDCLRDDKDSSFGLVKATHCHDAIYETSADDRQEKVMTKFQELTRVVHLSMRVRRNHAEYDDLGNFD